MVPPPGAGKTRRALETNETDVKLNISWGDSGFKIEMDGKLLTEEKHNHTPCFSSPVHFTFGHSTTPAGKLYIRKISLEEQE